MRRATLAATAVAPVTPLVAAALAGVVAITELAFVLVAAASLAFEAFARPIFPILARFARGRAIGRNGRRAFDGHCGLWPAEILVTATPAVPLALIAFAGCGLARYGFAGRSWLRAFGGPLVTAMMLAVAIVTRRPPLVGTSTGTPDFNQFGFGRCSGNRCIRGR